ncbi:MAG: hypothetical protein ACQETX_13610, partial [Pseudomonadota bacterium]
MKSFKSFLFCVALIIGALISTYFWRPEVGFAEENEPPFVSGRIATSSSVSGHFSYRSDVVGTFVARDNAPPIELEYHLWTLVGEPVWGFRAKTSPFRRLTFRTQEGRLPLLEIAVLGSLPEGTVRWNGNIVEVSRDLMDLASIYDFAFHAQMADQALSSLPTGSERIRSAAIYRSHQGIAGDPGQWGWSVPGSPDWGTIFTHRDHLPEPVTRESFDEVPIEADASKQIMKNLLEEFADRDDAAISRLETGDYQVRVGDLLHEIWKQEPDALSALMGVSSDTHRELADIMMGVAADLRQTGDTDDPAREAQRIDEILATHSEKFPNQLRQRWVDMKAEALEIAADRQLAEVMRKAAPVISARLGAGDIEASDEATRYLELGRDRMQASDHVSETMKRRWDVLESAMLSSNSSKATLKKLPVTDLEPGGRFGEFVAIDDDTASIMGETTNDSERVYIFERPGKDFVRTAVLTPNEHEDGDFSITGLDLHGDNAVITSREEISLFRRTSSGWIQDEFKYRPDSFWDSVKLHGDILFVGARAVRWPYDGYLDLYQHTGVRWEPLQEFETKKPEEFSSVPYPFGNG